MVYTGLSGASYNLESKHLASGGEGNIHRVYRGTSKKVAKIYHANKITPELEDKLKYMVSNPPDKTVLNQVAWPLDVLYDSKNNFCGFVMPELSIDAELKDIYQYPPTTGLSAKNKIIIAGNICAVISAVHNAGYVFGDFNPRNIGVDTKSGKVAFLDTDSYHVFDKVNKRLYRCKVCADGYAAPELLEACANHKAANPNDGQQLYEKTPLPTFTEETDNFALAIHIFKLLMNGFTPFGGIIETVTPSQASPSQGNAAIRRNEYSFRPGYKPMSPAVPPLEIFPQEITDLFTRAFLVIGQVNPSRRPTSIEWHQALDRYEHTLIKCKVNKFHQYDRKNKTCPFCEADTRYQSAISGNNVPVFTSPSPVVLPQQRTYENQRQRLSMLGKAVIAAVSIGVLVLGIGAFHGWFGSNDVLLIIPPESPASEAQPAAPTPTPAPQGIVPQPTRPPPTPQSVSPQPAPEVAVTRPLVTQPPVIPVPAPPIPLNLQAETPGTDSVTLRWDSAGSGISYMVHLNTQNDPSRARRILGIPVTVNSVSIRDLDSETNYYFWVSSLRDGQESGFSNVVPVRTAVTPPIFRFENQMTPMSSEDSPPPPAFRF